MRIPSVIPSLFPQSHPVRCCLFWSDSWRSFASSSVLSFRTTLGSHSKIGSITLPSHPLQIHTNSATSIHSTQNNAKAYSNTYEEYWEEEKVKKGLQDGTLLKGKLHIPGFSTLSAYVLPKNSSRPPVRHSKCSIKDFRRRNRAVHEDEVIIAKLEDSDDVPEDGGDATRYKVVSISHFSERRRNIVCLIKAEDYKKQRLSTNAPLPNNDHPTSEWIKGQPKDRRLPALIFDMKRIEPQSDYSRLTEALSQSKDMLVMADITEWSSNELFPKAAISVCGVIGKAHTLEANARAILALYGLEQRTHSKDLCSDIMPILAYNKQSKNPIWLDEALKDTYRADCRLLNSFTIDPPTAMDLDDSISVERLVEGGFKIGVHIADVSHFVRSNSDLDREAKSRTTSLYLGDMVFPMLPEILSQDICSLLPHKDRLTFSVFFKISSNGHLIDSEEPEIKKTITESKCRLNYKLVEQFINEAFAVPDVKNLLLSILEGTPTVSSYAFQYDLLLSLVQPIADKFGIPKHIDVEILLLKEIAAKHRHHRQAKGSITLFEGSIDFKLKYDEQNQRKPYTMEFDETGSICHNIVEECMIITNQYVAKRLSKCDVKSNSILRNHGNTERAAVESILLSLPPSIRKRVEDEFQSSNVQLHQLLRYCQFTFTTNIYQAICFAALQNFDSANYFPLTSEDEEEWKHWALTLESYMHFTSPIRRYGDLFVHRILTEMIYRQTKDLPMDELLKICESCNTKRRSAQYASGYFRSFSFNEFLKVRYPLGMPYDNAIITKLVEPIGAANSTSQPSKYAAIIYIPLLQEDRSVALDTLGVCPLTSVKDAHTSTSVQKHSSSYKFNNSSTKGVVSTQEQHSLDTLPVSNTSVAPHSTKNRMSNRYEESPADTRPMEENTNEGFLDSKVYSHQHSKNDFVCINSLFVRPIEANQYFWSKYSQPFNIKEYRDVDVEGKWMKLECYRPIPVKLIPGKSIWTVRLLVL